MTILRKLATFYEKLGNFHIGTRQLSKFRLSFHLMQNASTDRKINEKNLAV